MVLRVYVINFITSDFISSEKNNLGIYPRNRVCIVLISKILSVYYSLNDSQNLRIFLLTHIHRHTSSCRKMMPGWKKSGRCCICFFNHFFWHINVLHAHSHLKPQLFGSCRNAVTQNTAKKKLYQRNHIVEEVIILKRREGGGVCER